MTGETAVVIGVLLGGTAVIGAVSAFPPLTQADGSAISVAARANLEPPVSELAERAFCRETLEGVDCRCFATTASVVLDADHQRVAGWSYTDRHALARVQATSSCSR